MIDAISNCTGSSVCSAPLVAAMPVALAAGVISFVSPCVLPLVPGYLSYVTGMSGADLGPLDTRSRGRLLLGSALFVVGFSIVFVSAGVLFGSLGATLQEHAKLLTRILGAVTIVLGLAFLGALPMFQREVRVHRLPAAGLVAAPVLGFVFGLGWTPCIGPTLAAVLTLAAAGQQPLLGAALLLTYALGLGIPFLVVGVFLTGRLEALALIRRHRRTLNLASALILLAFAGFLASGELTRFTLRYVNIAPFGL